MKRIKDFRVLQNWKRVFIICLAMALILSISIVAFATDGGPATSEQTGTESTQGTKEDSSKQDPSKEDAASEDATPEDNDVSKPETDAETNTETDAVEPSQGEPEGQLIATPNIITPAEDVNVGALAELQAKVDAAANGDTIKLTPAFAAELAISTVPASITVTGNKSLTFDASAVSALTVGGTGAHFTFTNSGTGTITLTKFNLNGQGINGGIVLSGTTQIKDSYFTACKNRVLDVQVKTDLTVERSTFEANPGGGIAYRGNEGTDSSKTRRSLDVIDCNFQDNVITAVDGYIKGAAIGTPFIGWNGADCYNVNVTRSVFTGNKVVATTTASSAANNVDGGAIAIINGRAATTTDDQVHVKINDSTFENNFAQDDGGAILIEGAITSTAINSSIRNCTFTSNTCAGAVYGRSIFGMGGFCTDGTGGAISYYGLTTSEITHSTFYNNAVTNVFPAGLSAVNFGSVGGGGAVAVDTSERIVSSSQLPDYPTLSNNIFVGNKHVNPASQDSISLINSLTSNALGNMKERSKTGNVFILPVTDRDINSSDTRGLSNNGNIGYDNGNNNGANSYGTLYNNDGISLAGIPVTKPGGGGTINIPITPETVFASTTGSGATAVPTKEYYGTSVGASGHTAQHFSYMPSPLTDEMYRDGSGPYYDSAVRRDTRGYQRDHYPNAGAVEIYWTKFDPGVAQGGKWIASQVDFTALGGIQSMLDPDIYYLVTTPPPVGGTGSPGSVTTFPRSSFELGSDVLGDPAYLDWGFQGWKSNQPDSPGGSVYTPIQSNISVVSGKQTYVAIWEQNKFRIDFNFQYDDTSGTPQWGTPLTQVAKNATISAPSPAPTREDYNFGGWYKDAACNNVWNFASDQVTQDIILYAKWTIKPTQFTVNYDANGGSAPSFAFQIVTPGLAYGVHPTTSRAGHTFAGWFTELNAGNSVDASTIVTAASDHTLYAHWTVIPAPVYYTIIFDAGAYGSFSGALQQNISTVRAGDISPVAPWPIPTSGWQFTGYSPTYTQGVAVNSNATYFAQYKQIVTPQPPTNPTYYTVKFVDYDNTLLRSEKVVSGGSATPPSSPSRTGYIFTGWSGKYTNVKSNQTVVAQYSYITPIVNNVPTTSTGQTTDTDTSPTPPTPTPTVDQPVESPDAGTQTQPISDGANNVSSQAIGAGAVPLGGFFESGGWSLLSLILVALGIAIALMQFVRLIAAQVARKKLEQEDEQKDEQESDSTVNHPHHRWVLILTALIGIAALITFLILENFSLPMIWFNVHTLVIIILFIVEVAFGIASFIKKTENAASDFA